MKKLIAILLAVLMVCALFVGCGSEETATTETETETETEVEVETETETEADPDAELTAMEKYGFDTLDLVCFRGGNGDLWDEMVDLFLEYYPGVEVITDFSDDVANRIRARMMTDTPPDFVASSGTEWSLREAAEAGQIMDLSDFYENGVNADGVPLKDVIPETAMENAYINDIMVGLPQSTTYLGWWYNVNMFEELGITPPTNWDELYAAAEVLKANDIIPFMYQFPSYGVWGLSYEMMTVTGGKDLYNKTYITLEPGAWTSEEALKAIKAQEALVKDGVLSPLSVGADFAASQVDFVNGRIGMIPNGTWFETEMQESLPEGFEMAFIPFPALEEGGPRAVVLTGGAGGNIPVHALHPEAAKAWYGVILSDAGQALIAKYGSMPISQTLSMEAVEEVISPTNLTALLAAQEEDVIAVFNVETYYSTLSKELNSCNDDLCLGDITAEEYCERMEAAAEEVRNDPEVVIQKAR